MYWYSATAYLRLAEILQKVRARLRLAFAVVVGHVDELVLVPHTSVRAQELGRRVREEQVAHVRVAPLVEGGDRGSGAALGVEEDVRDAEADEALEEGLLEVGVGAECGVLDDRGILEVVAR